ncbi:MAG: hypothetical protein AAFX06_28615, partial [Planctomycetota bacterium]
MTANEGCPSQTLLDQLIAGDLDDHTESQVIRHVDGCTQCQLRLDSLEMHAIQDELSTLADDSSAARHEKVIRDTKSLLNQGLATFAKPSSEEITSHVQQDGYEILRLLGSGGMGVVFLAREIALNREVAIKVLAPELATQPPAVER